MKVWLGSKAHVAVWVPTLVLVSIIAATGFIFDHRYSLKFLSYFSDGPAQVAATIFVLGPTLYLFILERQLPSSFLGRVLKKLNYSKYFSICAALIVLLSLLPLLRGHFENTVLPMFTVLLVALGILALFVLPIVWVIRTNYYLTKFTSSSQRKSLIKDSVTEELKEAFKKDLRTLQEQTTLQDRFKQKFSHPGIEIFPLFLDLSSGFIPVTAKETGFLADFNDRVAERIIKLVEDEHNLISSSSEASDAQESGTPKTIVKIFHSFDRWQDYLDPASRSEHSKYVGAVSSDTKDAAKIQKLLDRLFILQPESKYVQTAGEDLSLLKKELSAHIRENDYDSFEDTIRLVLNVLNEHYQLAEDVGENLQIRNPAYLAEIREIFAFLFKETTRLDNDEWFTMSMAAWSRVISDSYENEDVAMFRSFISLLPSIYNEAFEKKKTASLRETSHALHQFLHYQLRFDVEKLGMRIDSPPEEFRKAVEKFKVFTIIALDSWNSILKQTIQNADIERFTSILSAMYVSFKDFTPNFPSRNDILTLEFSLRAQPNDEGLIRRVANAKQLGVWYDKSDDEDSFYSWYQGLHYRIMLGTLGFLTSYVDASENREAIIKFGKVLISRLSEVPLINLSRRLVEGDLTDERFSWDFDNFWDRHDVEFGGVFSKDPLGVWVRAYALTGLSRDLSKEKIFQMKEFYANLIRSTSDWALATDYLKEMVPQITQEQVDKFNKLHEAAYQSYKTDHENNIIAQTIDKTILNEFSTDVVNAWHQNLVFRKLIIECGLGTYVDNLDQDPPSDKQIPLYGFNILFPKEAFIKQEDTSYGDLGKQYGYEIARVENDFITEKIINNGVAIEGGDEFSKNIDALISSFPSQYTPSGIFVTSELYWDTLTKQINEQIDRKSQLGEKYKGIHGFQGIYKKLPIFLFPLSRFEKQAIAIIDLKSFLSLIDYRPFPEQKGKKPLFIDVRVLTDQNIQDIIKKNSDWEKKHGSKAGAEHALKQNVNTRVFARFEIQVNEPKAALVIHRPEPKN